MVLPPSTARATDQLVAHYGRLADATALPILVQDSPQITGVALSVEALAAIAVHPLVRALKVEIPGAGPKVSAARDAGYEIIAGWGGLQYLDSLARGASGCMPGCDLGPAILAIDRYARGGRIEEADGIYRAILPLLSWEAQSLDLILLGSKRHLVRQGIFREGALRAPGRTLDPQEAATLDGLLDRLADERIPGFEPGGLPPGPDASRSA
jgi:4-hydroxy-tetrahydrodipicolinate synthase